YCNDFLSKTVLLIDTGYRSINTNKLIPATCYCNAHHTRSILAHYSKPHRLSSTQLLYITTLSVQQKKPTAYAIGYLRAWQRPTLPGPCGPSTIGAERLNGRVRDGYAWFPFAIVTKRMLTFF